MNTDINNKIQYKNSNNNYNSGCKAGYSIPWSQHT